MVYVQELLIYIIMHKVSRDTYNRHAWYVKHAIKRIFAEFYYDNLLLMLIYNIICLQITRKKLLVMQIHTVKITKMSRGDL